MNQSEVRNWNRANRACESISRPEVPRLEAGLVCLNCGGTSGLPTVAQSIAIGGWVEVTVNGVPGYVCGASCAYLYSRHAKSIGEPTATVVPSTSTPAAAPTPRIQVNRHENVPLVTRVTKAVCGHCGQLNQIHQSRLPDGSWSPDQAKVLTFSGWIALPDGRHFCSRTCQSFAGAPRPAAPVPVTQIPDVSYQSVRAAHPRPGQRLVAQEVPDGPVTSKRGK
jgi:hypothetical protein